MQAELCIALSYGRAEMRVSTTLIFGTLVSWYSDTLISIGTLLFRTWVFGFWSWTDFLSLLYTSLSGLLQHGLSINSIRELTN